MKHLQLLHSIRPIEVKGLDRRCDLIVIVIPINLSISGTHAITRYVVNILLNILQHVLGIPFRLYEFLNLLFICVLLRVP